MKRPATRARVVFDCNTFLQAWGFENGPAAEALRLAERGVFELVVSTETLRELREVLEYPTVREISPSMTPERLRDLLERLRFRATLRRRVPRRVRFARDPKDEAYLNLALAANADHLVTRDRDLLSLMTDHSPFAKQFRRMSHPLQILDPVEFLHAIRYDHVDEG